MYKQIIIARKDLNLSPGKLAAQVSHGSMAFITSMIKENTHRIMDNMFVAYERSAINSENKKPQYYLHPDLNRFAEEAREKGENFFYAKPVDEKRPYCDQELCEPTYHYETKFNVDTDLYEQWVNCSYTKCVLQAKNKNRLLKAKTLAEELGMVEGKDFFCIYDNCYTELEPEEDNGTTLTCIGFRPMDSEVIGQVSKKYHLYM